MSKHFSDTREYIFPRTLRIADWGMPRGKGKWAMLKYYRVVATSFDKSLKRLTLGKSSKFEGKKNKDFQRIKKFGTKFR